MVSPMCSPPPAPQVKKKVVKVRGRRGFGGMWRAYVREKTAGKKGTQDLRALGMTYREGLASGEMDTEHLGRLGKAATMAGRRHTPKAGESAFAPTGRTEERKRAQLLRNALLTAAKGLDPEQAAIVLSQRLADMGGGVSAGLTAARAVVRLQSRHARHGAAAEDEALLAFRNGRGAQDLAELQKLLPSLEDVEGLMPVPTPMGVCFEVASSKQDAIADAVAWAFKSKQCNASLALREYWAAAHQAVEEPSEGAEPDTHARISECLAAGRCVCSGDGPQLRSLRNSCLRAMKRAFPAGSDERRSLLDGFVVLRLTGRPSADNLDALIELDTPIKEVWLQVGLMYLSPYRPTFMEVSKTSGPVEEDPGQERLWVKACSMETHPLTPS